MTQKLAAARLAVIAICLLLATPVLAQGDELQEAQQLLKQGQVDRALERVDQYLKTKPKDARGRFLRGILLTEQNKPQDAIKVFTELTQDYPELPEPYNNLAVLHASQGQYDKARAALEMAIRTHPSYATAHENLGDIYAKMASQAYDKALQLDKGNQGAQTKLNLIKESRCPYRSHNQGCTSPCRCAGETGSAGVNGTGRSSLAGCRSRHKRTGQSRAGETGSEGTGH